MAILKFSDHGENVRDRHRFSRHYVDGSSTCAIEATGLVVDETKAPVRCIGPNGR